ncbi:hypothetical protein GII30_03305 [Gordonia amarae]|uniref:Prokaryotic metallothionein n=3 Tax=Gordonia amarae TaxID=36821 RepID=G7GUJ0_9ACTN|nr:hypothetical protein [Gordonia amarae]GAB07265.1 hypothetical protein GOAMR_63_01120 [Gordonia amarae NBRC 15530]QHN16137.1 hypothetical protein GII35_03310 [Gordonia amarae]QHN20705.1 hypothetical protein GII34_03310 [Gordonia amarae]QHN29557.1 hypothetical protein GII32_03315 [Gordonia amarae]QHN38333.1 hypothetical protein GII30_03305 [Gordonia amarae]
MAVCDICGNDYDRAMTITIDGTDTRGVFDSFECAIHALAPSCTHCGCRVIGHGVEVDGAIFCCAHCAQHVGAQGVSDHSDNDPGQADRPESVGSQPGKAFS